MRTEPTQASAGRVSAPLTPEEIAALELMKFKTVPIPAGWIEYGQQYWSDGKVFVTIDRGGWLCGIYVSVYSPSGKLISICNHISELNQFANVRA